MWAGLGSEQVIAANRLPEGSQANCVQVSDQVESRSVSLSPPVPTSATDRRLTLQLDRLDGVVLLLDSEQLKVGESAPLALDSVDLDTQVGTLILPVELALQYGGTSTSSSSRRTRARTHVVDIEQVFGPQHVPTRDGHQADSSRLVGRLGSPVGKHVLLARSELPVRAPLKVQNSVDLDRLFLQETHRGELVHRDLGSEVTPGDVLVVRGPSEQGPRELPGSGHVLGLGPCGNRGRLNGLFTGEGSEQESGLDLPDGDLVALVFRSKVSGVLRSVLVLGRLGDDRVGRPGHEVLFTRRKVEELDTGVGESVRDGVFERFAGPEGDTDSVQRGQVSSLRGPRDVELSPSLESRQEIRFVSATCSDSASITRQRELTGSA